MHRDHSHAQRRQDKLIARPVPHPAAHPLVALGDGCALRQEHAREVEHLDGRKGVHLENRVGVCDHAAHIHCLVRIKEACRRTQPLLLQAKGSAAQALVNEDNTLSEDGCIQGRTSGHSWEEHGNVCNASHQPCRRHEEADGRHSLCCRCPAPTSGRSEHADKDDVARTSALPCSESPRRGG